MIREIRIKNYKSIQKLKMDIGQFTVLIGENGSGKTNILESIALASAAAGNKLDNEFLSSRGIRVTEPQFMRSAFDCANINEEIYINLIGDDNLSFECNLQNDNKPYSKWKNIHELIHSSTESMATVAFSPNITIEKIIKELSEDIKKEINQSNSYTDIQEVFNKLFYELKKDDKLNLQKFIIYSPENFSLRIFEKEGQIEPLGINGEGLFKLLKVLSSSNIERLQLIKEKLKFIDWFQDFEIPDQLSGNEKLIRIKDKYLDKDISYFDQKSSNEGFLFCSFCK